MESGSIDNIKVILHDTFEDIGKKIGNDLFVPISLIEKGYNIEKEWKEKEKTLKMNVTNAMTSDIKHYDYKGNYLHYDKNKVENWNVTFTNEGIPKTIYAHGEYFNPSTIAQYGLQHFSLYLKNNDGASKSKFLKVANWFVNHQDSRGGWAYIFDHDFYPSRLNKLKAPWYSAIGLGMGMSVLSRAFFLTKNNKYSICALKAKPLFKTSSTNNGVLAKFENKFLFYEECPTDPPSYILNGFMFSLIGLYDLYNITGDKDTKWLYDEGIITLKRMLPLYDLGNRTAYDLTHYTTDGGYPNVANWKYHIGHIHLLDALSSIEKDPKMKESLLRWQGYLKGKVK
ncbi:D-glucuronyl C5-epimerase family protein [Virgibacillus sp. NKC19-16]|uniref:D-glucuronyl C5-epimerase family protein n=1 Tax=Virgibacillus salidurans TaxID=2831673 RepID=UPI001F1B394A|nr:D-glucuronyl C5-epimerase family protein [Virgibacillus sp. NKC19-16]UJL46869.1 D-glucuronyl C5-epimerase family protein [Virgibacillus sp. NKC19-16]